MLQVFYLDIVYVFTMFFKCFHVFLQVFQMHVLSILSGFKRMLHVNVLKVDRVLHLPPRLLLPRLGVSSSAAFSLSYRCC